MLLSSPFFSFYSFFCSGGIVLLLSSSIFPSCQVFVEGSALCLVFCSTLAALVSVIPVLCSLILRSLRSWVLWEPLDSSPWIKLFQQGPTLVLHFPNNLSLFPLGFRSPRVIFILPPRASSPPSAGPNRAMSGAPWAAWVYANPTSSSSGVP